MPQDTNTFEVLADYNQFFLLDAEVQPPYPEGITEADIANRFKVAPNLLAIYTSGSSYVSLTIKQLPSAPPIESELWEHVVELPLELPSGRLAVAGCTDYLPECPEVKIAPGSYSVRIHGRGFGEDGKEEYLAILWLATGHSLQMLNQYNDPANSQFDTNS